ncbi:hypothetical protein LTS18_003329 [Coniosporium uncinatum]|uniref:Uncharacterized protein n=1 Tax=Coniosporium uncinatum TaxID=93489 RepID=A0ACC3DTJ4_9PEZI|nr:hypothetical protein LTS18_003329 [Coniosporium uncinatum]
MPPRPFPLPLRIGTDICHIPRIHRLITAEVRLSTSAFPRSLFKLLNRLLTSHEHADFWARWSRPSLSSDAFVYGSNRSEWMAIARYMAGRWAAKEAVIMTFAPERKVAFGEIVVVGGGKGRAPFAVVLDGMAEKAKMSSQEEAWREVVEGARMRERERGSGGVQVSRSGEFEEGMVGGVDGIHEEIEAPRTTSLADLEGQVARLSISHDGEYATAVCLSASSILDEVIEPV